MHYSLVILGAAFYSSFVYGHPHEGRKQDNLLLARRSMPPPPNNPQPEDMIYSMLYTNEYRLHRPGESIGNYKFYLDGESWTVDRGFQTSRGGPFSCEKCEKSVSIISSFPL